jgi:hypothetical protein
MDKLDMSGINRIVTGHDKQGKEVFDFEDQVPLLDLTPEHATFAVSLFVFLVQ